MKTTIEFELAAFTTPKDVASLGEVYVFDLNELSPETLAALCDEFRANVFKEAGKEPPPKVRPISRREEIFGVLMEIDATIKDVESHYPPGVAFSVMRKKIARAVAFLQA